MREMKRSLRRPLGFVSTVAIAAASSPAMAQGLGQAQSVAEDFRDQIQTIGPIVAVAALVVAAIAYLLKFVEKDMFGRIAIGCIVGGSASALVPMFWTGG